MSQNPRRVSIASIVLACRHVGAELVWLMRWNRNWGCYHFVGGHKCDDESFLECARREIGEEIKLKDKEDFTLQPEALRHLTFTAWSQRAKLDTDYTIELFSAVLRGKSALAALETCDVRWMTPDEVRTQKCADGRPISPTASMLLDSVGWQGIPPSFEPA